MAPSAQSIQQVRVLGGRNSVPQLQTVELGVTEAALDVFNNFVEHIAAGAVKENLEASKIQVRRSRRFATAAADPIPVTQPAPLQPKVKFVPATL